jgi:hypothetical protein
MNRSDVGEGDGSRTMRQPDLEHCMRASEVEEQVLDTTTPSVAPEKDETTDMEKNSYYLSFHVSSCHRTLYGVLLLYMHGINYYILFHVSTHCCVLLFYVTVHRKAEKPKIDKTKKICP